MPRPQAGSRGALSLEYLCVLAGMWEEALGHKLLPPPFPLGIGLGISCTLSTDLAHNILVSYTPIVPTGYLTP